MKYSIIKLLLGIYDIFGINISLVNYHAQVNISATRKYTNKCDKIVTNTKKHKEYTVERFRTGTK